MGNSTYIVPIDATGRAPYARYPLFVATGSTGGIFVTGTTMIPLTTLASGFYGYLNRIDGVCLATGTTGGSWALRNSYVPSGFVFMVLYQKKDANPGLRVSAEFPSPIQTAGCNNVNGQFSIQASSDLMGTWFFTINGFLSEL